MPRAIGAPVTIRRRDANLGKNWALEAEKWAPFRNARFGGKEYEKRRWHILVLPPRHAPLPVSWNLNLFPPRIVSPMHKYSVALLTIVLLSPIAQAEKPFFADPFLFGVHRGGSHWRPEHTVDTYKEVAERWPNALLEMDVRLTKDGVVVLHHDSTVNRTTDGDGPIEDLTLAEVQALDAGYDFTRDEGATFPYRGKGFRIATLDEVLTALPQARWLIEPKTDGGVVAAMAKIVKAHGAEERILIASFKPALVEEAKSLMPKAPTCYTRKTGMKLFAALRAGGETWTNYKPEDDVLSLSRGMVKQFQITAEEFRQVQAKGVKVQLHTLDTEEELQAAVAMGVDSILSDRPDVFEKVLNKN